MGVPDPSGVIFLLFSIGLSLSVERLLALRGYVFSFASHSSR